MPTDTIVNNLIINKLTKAQYDAIQNPSDTELYLVPDVIDTVPTSGSDNPITSGGVYTALSSKANTSDIPSDVSDLNNDAGYTTNVGTITGITMNNVSKGTSGVVDLGTVITEHQSLTNYVQKSQTNGLLKNDGTVDTSTYLTTETEPAYTLSAAANITSSDINAWNGKLDTIVFNTAYNATSNKAATMSDIPSAVTENTVSGWGFTKNTGTVTSTGGDVTVNNIQVVSTLPPSPDPNTLYLIPES